MYFVEALARSPYVHHSVVVRDRLQVPVQVLPKIHEATLLPYSEPHPRLPSTLGAKPQDRTSMVHPPRATTTYRFSSCLTYGPGSANLANTIWGTRRSRRAIVCIKEVDGRVSKAEAEALLIHTHLPGPDSRPKTRYLDNNTYTRSVFRFSDKPTPAERQDTPALSLWVPRHATTPPAKRRYKYTPHLSFPFTLPSAQHCLLSRLTVRAVLRYLFGEPLQHLNPPHQQPPSTRSAPLTLITSLLVACLEITRSLASPCYLIRPSCSRALALYYLILLLWHDSTQKIFSILTASAPD